MSTLAMKNAPVAVHPKKYRARDARGKAVGWSVVALVHVVVLWAIVSGTARDAIKVVKKPLEAVIVQEVIIPPPPPPPPPPPKKIVTESAPKVQAPPPPFVPPAEVAPPPTAAPVIESVQTPPPAPPVIAPPPPQPAPPAATVKQDIGIACPTQTRPEMPRQAQKDGVEGTVKAQALIRGGKVVEVTILSGPRVFHNSVRSAMARYACVGSESDILTTQEFDFKLQ
jgi:protein TonB